MFAYIAIDTTVYTGIGRTCINLLFGLTAGVISPKLPGFFYFMSIIISHYNKDFYKPISGKNPQHCIKQFEDWRQSVITNVGSKLNESWIEAQIVSCQFDNNNNCHMIFEITQCR
jgi:hypothetical protein